MTKRTKIFIALFLLVVVAGAGYVFLSRDIAPIDDSDLALPEPPTTDGENPYREIRTWSFTDEQKNRIVEAVKMINEPDGVVDWDFIDELLAEFANDLNAFDRYAGQSGWILEEKITLTTPFPELNAITSRANLRRIQIARWLENGDIDMALEGTLNLVSFGAEMQQVHGGGLIHTLVGFTTAGFGHRELSNIIARVPLEDAELLNLANQLHSLRFGADGMRNALRVEYRSMSELLPKIANGEIDIEGMNNVTDGSELKTEEPGTRGDLLPCSLSRTKLTNCSLRFIAPPYAPSTATQSTLLKT